MVADLIVLQYLCFSYSCRQKRHAREWAHALHRHHPLSVRREHRGGAFTQPDRRRTVRLSEVDRRACSAYRLAESTSLPTFIEDQRIAVVRQIAHMPPIQPR